MSDHSGKPASPPLFRRGVTDRAVRCMQAYIHQRIADTGSERQWWQAFSTYFNRQADPLSASQAIALEIATDSLLTHAGLQSWSIARQALTRPAPESDAPVR